jgi:hypothetical protein
MDRRRSKEGFQVATGTGDNAVAITKKIQEITQKGVFQPSGVLSSSFAEGFADAGAEGTATTPTAPAADKPKEEKPKIEDKPKEEKTEYLIFQRKY